MHHPLIMKFGGASLEGPQSYHKIAQIICSRVEKGRELVVVLSAMKDNTDQLFSLAKEIHPNPPRRELDMLVSAGERISIALLAMAFALAGREAISFTGSQSGIITTDDHSDARIVAVRPFRISRALKEGFIAIVAGFQGVSTKGEITTLGRGGSDTTAVALAAALNSPLVEFYKDVGGFFETDPKTNPKARLLEKLSYQEAYALAQGGAKVLHPRSVALAEKNGIQLHVIPGSIIGSDAIRKTEILFETDPLPSFALSENGGKL